MKRISDCKSRLLVSVLLLAGLTLATAPVLAQGDDQSSAMANANNPLANMTAFNFQDYFIPELTESENVANQFWFRFAKPFGKWLTRSSLPVNSYPAPPGGGYETGLGDLNIFAAYLIDTGNPALSVGIGPQITAPTTTDDALGSGKWSGGFAHVLFNGNSKKVQWGYLLTWQGSFAGDDDRADVNLGAMQPFVFYQLGKGLYLRSTGIMAYNFETDGYSVPIGFGIGKVIPVGKTVYNAFIEPQVSVADDGPGWPSWQIFAGFNIQLVGG